MAQSTTTAYTKPPIDKKYVAVFAIAVFFSWTLHEVAHWMVGTWLGYKMGITLNTSYPLNGQYAREWHYQVVSAGGPVFTLCEAILVFLLMKQQKRLLLYPFLFTCFYMRLFATIISFRNANDEARISSAIGVGKCTLPIIVTLLLFMLVYSISKKYGFDTKFHVANTGLVIFFSSVIILTDLYFKVQLF